jgi:hypothetical protein
MANSLFPSFVKILSASAYGLHVQIVPTTLWSPGGTFGSFIAWDSTNRQADTMIEEFITAEAAFYPTTYNFYAYEIYTQASPIALPVLQVAANIDIDGDVASPPIAKATQATWSFGTTLSGLLKIVNLDVAVSSFEKITSATATVDQIAFIDVLFDSANGWSGRDGGQPTFFKQISYTLNEKLRREYHMN